MPNFYAPTDERVMSTRYYAPSEPQHEFRRSKCCARCLRGERGHNMPCAYREYACPNKECRHGGKNNGR